MKYNLKSNLFYIVLALLMLGSAKFSVAETPENSTAQTSRRKLPDLIYKTIGEESLKLDLYLPAKTSGVSALIIWVHGGGWRAGDKKDVPILPLVSAGFAIASVDYRLSGQAKFPAQIEDVKAAIRWLRLHAPDYGLDVKHFGIIGHSAGGHLASLAGITGQNLIFDVGDNLHKSSAVQAVCVMSGPSDMATMFEGADENRRSALVALLGGSLPEKQKLAEAASPLTYVHSNAPPFLFIHGADDQTVPVQQAVTMSRKLEAAGVKQKLIILPQTGHDVFARRQQFADEVRKFFTESLGNK
ncbi:MAG TPA: alpha/beta hydrolase [Methylomirabilota bacterium]|nr:alpha/beta hydrolase [Methylomirabilota bacterium]